MFDLNDLERIINTISDPVFVKDRQHTWVLLNDAFCRFMAVDRVTLIGKSDRDFFPPEEAEVFFAKDETVFESGIENVNDEEFTDANGQKHFITTKKSLFSSSKGQRYIVGCIRDLTALRQAQQALQDARDRLEHMVDERTSELAATNEALRRQIEENLRTAEQLRQSQKMEAVGRLAGGIAHDFNNLLSIIIGYASLLEDSPASTPEVSRCTEHITSAAQRAASLTSQLLAFSRNQALKPEVLDLHELLRSMAKLLPPLLGQDVELVIATDAASCCIEADRSQIEQVVMNLATNARDAMRHGGRFTIETSNTELDREPSGQGSFPREFVVLCVSDTGDGIDPETQTHMFEPFFTTKDPGKGTGLGLATVYAVVTRCGGHIEVDSEVARGTTLRIYLPVATGQAESPSSSCTQSKCAQGRGTVLLVEDEESLRDLLRMVLTSKGYTVLEADSGTAALKVLAGYDDNIDLLITDVIMPGMRGWELATRVLHERPQVEVLYISGHTDVSPEAERMILESGGLLRKPFRPEELVAKVQEMISAKAAAAVISAG